MSGSRRTILIFSQVFVPDPASVGQHLADVGFALAKRGHRVVVYTSARGYEDPTRRYRARETLEGVEIRRLPLGSFGKRSIPHRVIGGVSFLLQCALRAMFTRGLAGILVSTSPPMAGIVGVFVGKVRRVPVAFWSMDLNPDQLVALGKIRQASWSRRLLDAANRFVLRGSSVVVALDRFMAERLERKVPLGRSLVVIPPWPHENHVTEAEPPAANPFRTRHGLEGKFVVMYSGNHSPSNPLRTLLDAAVRLRDDDQLRFLFVGGGHGKREVEEFIAAHDLRNVVSLPYQPLEELRHSLSAADVHVVSLGDAMVGIIHPCKIYGAMAAGRPLLYLGPEPSHIADLLTKHEIGWHVRHGDTEGALRTLREIRALPAPRRAEMGEHAREVLARDLSQGLLCGEFCDRLEFAFGRPSRLPRAAGHPLPSSPAG